jgi:hypothetical protein
LSHALNGASAAGILFTPLWVLLIDKTGFVVAAALVGVVMTATIWPLAGHFLGPTPETKGVAPDGEASSQRVRTRQPQRQARPLRTHDLTGGYAVPFTAAAVCELAAGTIVLTGREMLRHLPGGSRPTR